MHPWLAFVSFWKLLFGGKLPAEVAKFLPEAPKLALPPVVVPNERDKPKVSAAQYHRDGALALLALLQREAQLVDFVRESIDGVDDAQLGAATRAVHRNAAKVIAQHVTLEPVMPGEEDAKVSVPKGFDPAEIRLIGEAKGEPPYRGTLRHRGWRATEVKLPTLAEGVDRTVIAPAEVEV
ncbi:MAG TPA: DUF2760 domain-containing protein [Kofleriaceae bacterium]|jgi:hypothetical protein|nr:DUF2760 domain-containing protein [Kofleriaceae bacterium]